MGAFNVIYHCLQKSFLQHLVDIQTEIQGSIKKLSVFKVSRGHSSKVAKLPIIASGALDQSVMA